MKSWAPGRICLLGDKSDLLGRPVIAAAVTRFLNFEFSRSVDGRLDFYNSDTKNRFSRNFNENGTDEFFKFLSQIAWRLRDKIQPVRVHTYGDLPIGAGLSSSASCSIGFIRGLDHLFGLKLKTAQIAELAYDVERNDLGIMCGRMDQYSIAFGGVTFIETGDQTQVTRIPMKSIPFVIGDSQEPRQAKVILNKTMKLLDEKDPAFVGYFEQIHQNVLNGHNAIRANDFNQLGKLLDVHHSLEQRMGASTKRIDAMVEGARKAGALGAKQVGAGGGGCMIALAPDNAFKVIAAIEKAGGRAWSADLFNYPQ
jgi:mevalonate kinase